MTQEHPDFSLPLPADVIRCHDGMEPQPDANATRPLEDGKP